MAASTPRAELFILNLGHGYAHLTMLLFPTVALALEIESGLAYGSILWFGTASYIAFGFGSLPSGWLGDTWSRPKLMGVFYLGCGASLVMAGLSPNLPVLGISLLLLGCFASIYHPVGLSLVVNRATGLGSSLGLNALFGNLGMALAPVLAAVLATKWGWRTAFIGPGIAGCLLGMWWLLACNLQEPAAGRLVRAALKTTALWPPADVVRGLVLLGVATLLSGISFNIMTIALPKMVEAADGQGLTSLLVSGASASVILAIAAFVQLGVGRLIDRSDLVWLMFAVMLCQVPLTLIMPWVDSGIFLICAALLVSLMFGEIPIHDTLVARCSTNAWRGRAYAAKYMLSLGVSAVAIPLIATVQGRVGFTPLFILITIFALLIAGIALGLPARVRFNEGVDRKDLDH